MANAIWPLSLPQVPLKDGYSEDDIDVVLRTEMDAGPPKRRRRFSKDHRPVALSFRMTQAQRETFETFFRTTIEGGALPFDFTLPGAAAVSTCYIAGPPRYTPRSPGRWTVALQFEVET